MSIFGHEMGKKNVAVFDVGEDSVGASIIQYVEGSAPLCLASARRNVVALTTDTARTANAVAEALSATLAELPADCPRCSETHVIFHEPFIGYSICITSDKTESPSEVSESCINEIIETQKGIAEKDVLNRTTHFTGKPELVEHRAMRVRLNGYDYANPFGMKAQTAEVVVYLGYVDSSAANRVRAEIAKSKICSHTAVFHTWPIAVSSVMRDILTHEKRFIVLDVGYTRTSAFFVDAGIIMRGQSFPVGARTVARSVAQSLGVEESAAIQLIKLYEAGQASEDVHRKVEDGVAEFKEVWMKEFGGIVLDTARTFLVPPKMYFVGDNMLEMHISEGISSGKLNHVTPNNKPFVVTRVSTELMKRFVCGSDIVSMLETLYIRSLFNPKHG